MKKFIIYNVISTLITIAIGWFVVRTYLDPMLREIIIEKATETLGVPVSLRKVKTQFYPPRIDLYDFDFTKTDLQKNGITVKLEMAEFRIDPVLALQKKYSIFIVAYKPSITLTQTVAVPQLTDEQVALLPPPAKGFDPIYLQLSNLANKMKISLNVEITNGILSKISPESAMKLENLNLAFNMPSFFQNWDIELSSDVHTSRLDFALPVKLKANIALESSLLKVIEANATVAEIPFRVAGSVDLNSMKHQWDVKSKVENLGGLKFSSYCFQPSGGSVSIDLKASTGNYGLIWKADGVVSGSKVYGQADCKFQNFVVRGPISIDTDIQLSYDKILSFKKIHLNSNLDPTQLGYKDLFKKSVNKKLRVEISGMMADDIFSLQMGKFELDRLAMKAYGSISTNANKTSELHASLSRASLQGIQEFFPILEGYPVQGNLEFFSHIKGSLSNPQGLDIEVNPLRAQNVKARINWANASKTMSINGPISVNVNGIIRAQGQNLKQADVTADIDLNSLNIHTPGLVKRANTALNVKLTAKQQGNKIQIKSGEIKLPSGTLDIAGTISGIGRPVFDLSVRTPQQQIDKLLGLFPRFSSYKVIGTANAKLKIFGNYDFNLGIEKSFITISGQMGTKIMSLALPSPPAAAISAAAISTATTALAPNWPIVKNLNISIYSSIQNFRYDTMNVAGIETKGMIKNGYFYTTGHIQDIFGGQVQIQKFRTSLIEKAAPSELSINVKNFHIGSAINWKFPQWKNLVSGIADGTLNFNLANPNSKEFFIKSKGNGNLKIRQGFLSTLPFDKAINERISKIPLISDTSKSMLKVNSKGATVNILSNFQYSDGKFNFSNFDIITPERNQLQANGYISIDKNIDMKGKAFIVNAPIKGTIAQANSDSTGRLIVPIKITGNVMEPNLNLSDETISTMSRNALELEGKKFKQKVGDQLKKKATDEIKKLLK